MQCSLQSGPISPWQKFGRLNACPTWLCKSLRSRVAQAVSPAYCAFEDLFPAPSEMPASSKRRRRYVGIYVIMIECNETFA
jgi:hypothetical protein